MKIYDAIKAIDLCNTKIFRAKEKPYIIHMSSTGGISMVREKSLNPRPNTIDITGEVMIMDWQEVRPLVTAIVALAEKAKRIKPVGAQKFYSAEEWLLKICDDRTLLNVMWEIE
jgi:hypothetical protein